MTKVLAELVGARVGMWFGAGYPRSGTTWLCHLMSGYLDIPFVRRYRLPVLMPCVVHSHWLPSARTPRTLYVVRDGRDVVVSRYFYEARAVVDPQNSRGGRLRRERFHRLYGPDVDLDDVTGNLPRFIEDEMRAPQLTGVSWPDHVRRWLDRPQDQVAVVRYESLAEDAVATLAPAFEQLTGVPVDRDYLCLTAERFAFGRQAARVRQGDQGDSAGFLRRGVVGDWRRHFSAEASEVFQQYAGDLLAELDYPV